MQDAHTSQRAVRVRRATRDDYPSFSRLFPELLVDDPIPTLDVWLSRFVPTTWVAVRGAQVLGYCYFQEYQASGYVRNVVVAPGARRAGVGRALMQATADELRSHGKQSWCLNVKPDNLAALALYERMGMRLKYSSRSLRLSWSALPALPKGEAAVRTLTEDRDATFEALFALPAGQLASARSLGRSLLEAIAAPTLAPLGVAVFDPNFPGAFPFRVTEIQAVRPLLEAMRQQVPSDAYVNLVAEDDDRLVALLENVGASLSHEILHLQGAL
jgi:ribosomal protein S18 acetylase RimI-like enzyme